LLVSVRMQTLMCAPPSHFEQRTHQVRLCVALSGILVVGALRLDRLDTHIKEIHFLSATFLMCDGEISSRDENQMSHDW
jgi:hypothetical protein